MSEAAVGGLVLLLIVVVVALVLWIGKFRVVYPDAAIVEVFGRPRGVKNKAGLGWVFPWPFAMNVRRVPGRWETVPIVLEDVLTSDNVFAKAGVKVFYRICRTIPGEPDKPVLGDIDPGSAQRFAYSWPAGGIGEAIETIVRSTTEQTVRKFKAFQLGQSNTWQRFARSLEIALDRQAGGWGVDIKVQVTELSARDIALAAGEREQAVIRKARLMADAEGFQAAVAFVQAQLGPDMAKIFATQSVLTSTRPRALNFVNVGTGIVNSLSDLILGSTAGGVGRLGSGGKEEK